MKVDWGFGLFESHLAPLVRGWRGLLAVRSCSFFMQQATTGEGRWFSFLLVFSLVFSGFLGVFFGGFLFFSPGFLNDFKPEKTKENYKL